MAELGGCVDKLELDLLQRCPRGLRHKGPPQSDAPLLGAWHGSLWHTAGLSAVASQPADPIYSIFIPTISPP